MRALLKAVHIVLSLFVLVGAANLAFALAEGYLVASGRIKPGETIEYLETPAPQVSESAIRALVSLAVICLAALAQRRLKRSTSSAPHNMLKPTAKQEPNSSEPPGSGGGLT